MKMKDNYKDTILRALGENLRNLRIAKNLTQEDIGELTRLNYKYIGEIERGEKNPTAIVIYKLSQALGVSVSEILSGKDNPLIEDKMFKEVERLFAGKEKQNIRKAIKILEAFFE